MSDQKLGQPVRTEADADERLQSKLVDHTTPSQGMTVDTDGNAHTESHGNDPGGTDRAMRTSEQGSPSIDGEYHASNNTDPSQVGMVAMERNASPADSQQTQRLTSVPNSAGDVRSLDSAIRHSDGEPISESNPLHVTQAENPGDEIADYKTDSAIATDASANHDYTVSGGKTLIVDCVEASASSRSKMEIQVETGVATDTYNTVGVKFGTSSNPNMTHKFKRRLKVAAGVRLRVIRTNRDNQAQDLYSTIIGVEV